MKKQMLKESVDEIPYSLKSTQEWFASVITNRLGENDCIQPYSSNGMLIAEEAARYIIPSHTHLDPKQRIQIYNQQYWWRLLSTLHTNFPLVTRLFGYQAFNEEIGIPYLLACPPDNWSLTILGERLPKWIADHYHEPDLPLVYNAASLDWAFTLSFITASHPPLDLSSLVQGNPESLLSYTFYVQPHLHLFKWDYDLLSFRASFLKQDVEYWIENRFPDLPKGKKYFILLYRNLKNNIAWREISEGEWLLLSRFQQGASIIEACDYIETQEASLYDYVATNLQKWLQEWTAAGWLTLIDKEENK